MTHEDGIKLSSEIFAITEEGFNDLAIKIFRFQYACNPVYRQYCDLIKCKAEEIAIITEIPFLPVSMFKSKELKTTSFDPEMIFESSGTTGSVNSRHFLKHKDIYEESFIKTFTAFYGNPEDLCILGLLPSYLERTGSSLVYMTETLIKRSVYKQSGFYLHNHQELYETLLNNESRRIPTLLIGVTYALLDFAEAFPMKLRSTIIMETGGMKGRKKEITRNEVHRQLQKHFQSDTIHSEYGMTELLSQAYAKEKGLFTAPPWMRMMIRAEDDPFFVTDRNVSAPVSGAANIIDLANIYSCSFLATDDLTILHPDKSFEILGRIDNSDIRGCALMIRRDIIN